MIVSQIKKPTYLNIISVIALLFGLLTIKSGGEVLFLDGVGRANAGNYVSFVLWFNFTSGFLYIFAAISIFQNKKRAYKYSLFIVASTATVFFFLGIHILNDGLYEARTVGAMSMRTVLWLVVTVVLKKGRN